MKNKNRPKVQIERLNYIDEELARINLPRHEMIITRGIGSGLSKRKGADANQFWAIGDRGPNFKFSPAIEKLGMLHLESLAEQSGVKIMPMPEIGPTISELQIDGDKIICVRNIALKDKNGKPLSGLPAHGNSGEIAVDLEGNLIAADSSGVDSEGIVALSDGTFWVADEYCPSLLLVDEHGIVQKRIIPKGQGALFASANYEIIEALPKIAAMRHFNRGFEAITISNDENHLFIAFQSPLSHPNDEIFKKANLIRIWKICAKTCEFIAQYIYPLDPPKSFNRDNKLGNFGADDVKISELCFTGNNELIVLERGSATSKLYKIQLDKKFETADKYIKLDMRPTIEQLNENSAKDAGIELLEKSLLFNSDDFEELCSDIEGVITLDNKTILLVNDNDFGVEGAQTEFWKLKFERPF